jgi:putative transposase
VPGDPGRPRLKSIDVIDALSDLFILRGIPQHIRSDNGPEFVAKVVQDWIAAIGARTATIAPGSPWENGFIESFNARLRDELLDGEVFYTLREAQIVIESWRRHYNAVRPHASLGYRAPAPEVFVPALAAWPAAQPRQAPPATLPLALTQAVN